MTVCGTSHSAVHRSVVVYDKSPVHYLPKTLFTSKQSLALAALACANVRACALVGSGRIANGGRAGVDGAFQLKTL